MPPSRLPFRSAAGFAILLFGSVLAPAPCPAAAFGRISAVSDLGLFRTDVPVSRETRMVYLVDPALNRPADLQALLAANRPAGQGWKPTPFTEAEIQAFSAAGRPGTTAAYDAVADVAEQFFKFM